SRVTSFRVLGIQQALARRSAVLVQRPAQIVSLRQRRRRRHHREHLVQRAGRTEAARVVLFLRGPRPQVWTRRLGRNDRHFHGPPLGQRQRLNGTEYAASVDSLNGHGHRQTLRTIPPLV